MATRPSVDPELQSVPARAAACGRNNRQATGAWRRGASPSIEIGDVLGKVLDIGVRQRGGHAGHVARVIGPASGLEVLKLLLDVLRVLAGEARDLVLSDKPTQMGDRAQYSVGRLAARLDLGAIGLKFDRRRLLRRNKIAQGD